MFADKGLSAMPSEWIIPTLEVISLGEVTDGFDEDEIGPLGS
jgi:hypothetical protein